MDTRSILIDIDHNARTHNPSTFVITWTGHNLNIIALVLPIMGLVFRRPVTTRWAFLAAATSGLDAYALAFTEEIKDHRCSLILVDYT
jgi:hypothetical protein